MCRFLYPRPQLSLSGDFRLVWVTAGSFPDERGATFLLFSPLFFLLSRLVMSNLSIKPPLVAVCLHYLLAAPPLSRLLLSACLLPVACPLQRPWPAPPPSLTLPPPLLLNSSRSLTLCLPPLFPACLPTEDCDCEGYFNGQYIGESVHTFLHLLLPICSLPAAAWLCAGSPGAFVQGVKNECS